MPVSPASIRRMASATMTWYSHNSTMVRPAFSKASVSIFIICKGTRVGQTVNQADGDLFQRQDVSGRIQFGGGLGHAVDGAGILILRHGVVACLAQGLEAPGA